MSYLYIMDYIHVNTKRRGIDRQEEGTIQQEGQQERQPERQQGTRQERPQNKSQERPQKRQKKDKPQKQSGKSKLCVRCFRNWKRLVQEKKDIPDCDFSNSRRKKCLYCSERRSDCLQVSKHKIKNPS